MLALETRVRKKASRVPQGDAVLAFVQSVRIKEMLRNAAGEGRPPLTAIAPQLLATFPDAVGDLQVRQLVGLAVQFVLAEAGFVVANPRQRVPDNLPFQFGATFRRPEPGPEPGLVERFVAALSPEEAESAYRLLGKRLGRR